MRARRISLCVALILFSGCGLINALDKLKNITFMLPKRMYSVSTDDPTWKAPPAGGIPAVPCGPGGLVADCCMPAPGTMLDCVRSPLVCAENKCALKFLFEQVKLVDLAMEVPSLAQFKGQIFSQVLLKEINLELDNQMNVATPPVGLYVAPMNVMTAADPNAKKLATLPSKPAGFKGPVTVPLDDAAQQAFSAFAKDFQTPFNIILSTDILVKSGDPVPMGKIDLTVSGTVQAGL